MSCLIFFFQAEDGIRDLTVTGVQTCALPISVFACRSDGDPATAIHLYQSRAKSARLPGGKLPGLAGVKGVRSRALGLPGLLVVSSDDEDMVVAIGHNRKNSGRSLAVSYGRFRYSA